MFFVIFLLLAYKGSGYARNASYYDVYQSSSECFQLEHQIALGYWNNVNSIAIDYL